MENVKNISEELNEKPASQLEKDESKETSHEQSLKLMSPMQMVLRRFFRSKLSVVGLVMIVALFLFCWVGPLIYQVSPTEIDKDGKVEYTERLVEYTDENGVLIAAKIPFAETRNYVKKVSAARAVYERLYDRNENNIQK